MFLTFVCVMLWCVGDDGGFIVDGAIVALGDGYWW